MKLGNTLIFIFRFRAIDLSHALVVYNSSTPIKRMRFTPVRPILANQQSTGHTEQSVQTCMQTLRMLQ